MIRDGARAPELEYREAVQADVPRLAEFNRQLIEDEWDGGGMSRERLEQRMHRWLEHGDYRALLFESAGETVAYTLLSVSEDSAYIRHFYVLPTHRGSGIGRRVVETLFSEVIPRGTRVTLDVLASNTAGLGFWRSSGFHDYAVRMERVGTDAT